MPLNEHAVRNVSLHMDVPRQLVKGEGVAVRRLPSEYQIATYQNLTRGEKEGFAELEERVWEGGVLVGGEEVEVRYRQAPSLMVTIGNVCAEGCYDKELEECILGEFELESEVEAQAQVEAQPQPQTQAQEEAKEEKQERKAIDDPETSDCSKCYHIREGPCKEFFLGAHHSLLEGSFNDSVAELCACASGYAYYDIQINSMPALQRQFTQDQ